MVRSKHIHNIIFFIEATDLVALSVFEIALYIIGLPVATEHLV